jgi:hypothetical protein
MMFFGSWHSVDSSVDASVSEKCTISTFSPEDGDCVSPKRWRLVSESTWHQDPEDHHHHPHCRENLKYYISHVCVTLCFITHNNIMLKVSKNTMLVILKLLYMHLPLSYGNRLFKCLYYWAGGQTLTWGFN